MATIAEIAEEIIGDGGLVATNWPEVEVTMTADQTDRFNWRELLEQLADGNDLGFRTPFVVLQFSMLIPSTDISVCTVPHDALSCSLHYIRKNKLSDDEETAELTIAEVIAAEMETMRNIIWEGGLSTFQCVRRPSIDVGDNNPANLVFLENNHPLQAGTLNFIAETWPA